MINFLGEAQELFEYTRGMRRDFHQHPELGFQEVRTSGIVARELNSIGLHPITGIAGTGVVAMIEGASTTPVILLRFDMDALPIKEETGAEYASANIGLMHACGHDAHVAIGLSVARLLQEHRNELPGSVKLVFQPAEEGMGGAQRMVEAGVLKNPRPDLSLACHVWNEKPTGWYGVANGSCMAAGDSFRITITGKGGHGAMPHLAIDPVIASAQVVVTLQSIISRNVTPLESAVVSVTMLHGGEAFNIIPPKVELQGTIRSFEPNIRNIVIDRFKQIVHLTAEAYNCEAYIEIKSITPAVINHSGLAKRIQEMINGLFPGAQVDADFKTMGSEDMAFFMQDIPGCFIFFGSANTEKGLVAVHHHPKFDIDESILSNAVALIASATVDFLKNWNLTI